jgi:DNA adenine methylase
VLRKAIPSEPFNCYREPFVGGGALFFDLAPDCAALTDSNPELISCYTVVRDTPEQLIRELSHFRVSEKSCWDESL